MNAEVKDREDDRAFALRRIKLQEMGSASDENFAAEQAEESHMQLEIQAKMECMAKIFQKK